MLSAYSMISLPTERELKCIYKCMRISNIHYKNIQYVLYILSIHIIAVISVHMCILKIITDQLISIS